MNSQNRRGFTLFELLVSVAIIAILAAILIPAVQAARTQARTIQCLNNFKQIGVALHNYESAHTVYPPSFIQQKDGNPPLPGHVDPAYGTLLFRGHWTGFHLLLPFLDHKPLHSQFDFDGTWLSSMVNSADNRAMALNQTPITVLLCPSVLRQELKIGSASTSLSTDVVMKTSGNKESDHWMAGSPTDYSFSHGTDNIQAVDSREARACPGGIPFSWHDRPLHRRGAFGINSNCKHKDFVDGTTQTFMMGEKAGNILSYQRMELSVGTLNVEYPWAMAAVTFYASTGAEGIAGSFWVAPPFGVTRDIRLPYCPDSLPGVGVPHPMNPYPRDIPANADERSFYSFQSVHKGGVHFLFGDGGVHRLNNTINQRVYEALSTISGSEVVAGDEY